MHSWSVTYRKQDDAWSAVTSCYFDIFIDSVYFILIVFTSSRSSTSHCSSFPTKPRQHGKRIHAKTVISLLWCLVSYGNTKSGSFFYNSLWVRVFIDAKVISLFSPLRLERRWWLGSRAVLLKSPSRPAHAWSRWYLLRSASFPPGPLLLGTLEGQNAFFVSAA